MFGQLTHANFSNVILRSLRDRNEGNRWKNRLHGDKFNKVSSLATHIYPYKVYVTVENLTTQAYRIVIFTKGNPYTVHARKSTPDSSQNGVHVSH